MDYVHSFGIKVSPFYEDDDGLTAFATEPIFENQRSVFRRFNCISNNAFQEKMEVL